MTSALDILGHDSIPFVEWDQFMAYLDWKQGEHVALIGPTGAGKTTLAQQILGKRTYIVVCATKPRDSSLSRFGKIHRYKVVKTWNPRLNAQKYPRRILWPDARSLHASSAQSGAFLDMLSSVYETGGWCVYMDELYVMDTLLGLRQEVKTFLMQGRSMGLSLVCSTQRPAWVPLEIYDQSTHLFFWADNDEANLSRISGIGSFSSNRIREAVSRLRKYEVLYLNTREREMYRTMAPAPSTLKVVK